MAKLREPPAEARDEQATLADCITRISDGMTRLLASGLNEKAVLVLLHDATKVPRGHIEAVLGGLTDLKKRYCR